MSRSTHSKRSCRENWAWEKLYTEELKALGIDENAAKAGICLSGGGVRSAVTCMGILEVLSKRRLLRHFHYLSTVSGGGYAGAAMTTWLDERMGATTGESAAPDSVDVPFVADSKNLRANISLERAKKLDENAAYIRHVRANVSYLAPNGALGVLRGFYIVARAMDQPFCLAGFAFGLVFCLTRVRAFGSIF